VVARSHQPPRTVKREYREKSAISWRYIEAIELTLAFIPKRFRHDSGDRI
jgi:hypothetical protein